MDFPLAHDENGCPVQVPAAAAGWLVRRHAGGRGRPGAVYDGDGRPLVVALETTAADLKLLGCRAGAYRLDAVDGARRLLGVAAYTELRAESGDESELVEPSVRSDGGLAALARAVEAMQRVQAERERAQAEMLGRLIERLAPPVPIAPRNASEVVREYSELHKVLRKLAPEEEGEKSGARSVLEIIASMVEQVAVVVGPVLQQKWQAPGAASEAEEDDDDDAAESGGAEGRANASRASGKARGAGGPAKAPRGEKARQQETGDGAGKGSGGKAGASEGSVDNKLAAVFALLTPDEAREVRRISERMPAALLEQAMRALSAMTAEEAAAEIRRRFLAGGRGKPAAASNAAPDDGANGTSNQGGV